MGGPPRHDKGGGKAYAASMLGPSSLAGGKGKGGGRSPGKGGHMNPLDSTGQRMLCHRCGSDRHLVRNCPKRVAEGRGKGQPFTAHVHPEYPAGAASSAPAASSAAASRGPLAGTMQRPFFALMDREQPGDIPLLITMPRSAEPAAASLFRA